MMEVFDPFINQHYNMFTLHGDSTFESLGKLHVEGNQKKEGKKEFKVPSDKNWKFRLTTHPMNRFEFDWGLILPPPITEVLQIEGEELYASPNEDERNRFLIAVEQAIATNGRIFLEGGAGFGKSTLVQMLIRRVPDLNYIILCPLGSLIDKVWGGFDAMTDASALGHIVGDDGQQTQNRRGIDFSTLQLLILDEAYLCNLENILKLKRKMEENPQMKVVFLGCPFQCDAIVKPRKDSVMTRPIAEVLDEVFSRMFPNRIVLRINKRSPKDSEKLAEIKRMLFEEKEGNRKTLDRMVEQGWVGGTISNDESLIRSGISTHICFTNAASIEINELVHCKMYRQPYRHEVADGTMFLRRSIKSDTGRICDVGLRCKVLHHDEAGMRLRFEDETEAEFKFEERTRDRMASDGHRWSVHDYFLHPVGVYVVRSYQMGLTRNTRVRLVALPTEENKQQYIFRNPESGKDVSVKRSRVDFLNFRLPYCVTTHSAQGTTINERFCVHEMEWNESPKLLWTAITRGVSLKSLYIGKRRGAVVRDGDFKRYSEIKLKTYIDSDKKAGRHDGTEGAYSLERMTEMCKESHMRRCPGLVGQVCDNFMVMNNRDEAISFDRIDCKKGHTIDNLRVVCLACNRHAQDRDEAY